MITISLSGASKFGFHHYLAFGGCPRKASLDIAYESSQHTTGTHEGVVLHALAELYYGGTEFEFEDLLFDPPVPGYVIQECKRVWEQYVKDHPRDEFGEVIAVEKLIEGPVLEEAIGVSPFSMKTDMVCEMDADAAEGFFQRRPELLLPPYPGRFLVDHKWLKKTDSNMNEKYRSSLQMVAYMTGWNATHPDQQVDGAIINAVIKTKVIKTQTIFVPPPSKRDVEVLRENLRYWKFIKENFPNQTNARDEYCFGWGDGCRWRGLQCDRGVDGLVQINNKLKGAA